jgi:hypothetical protein
MIDPFSVTGILMMSTMALRKTECPVCKLPKPFVQWRQWTCCRVRQCPACAAATEAAKCCSSCGSDVK